MYRKHADTASGMDRIVSAEDKKLSESNVTRRNINLVTTNGSQINLLNIAPVFDENMNIFLYDTSIYAVHVFLVNSQYLCQLLSLFDIKNEPNRIAQPCHNKW